MPSMIIFFMGVVTSPLMNPSRLCHSIKDVICISHSRKFSYVNLSDTKFPTFSLLGYGNLAVKAELELALLPILIEDEAEEVCSDSSTNRDKRDSI